MSAAAAAAPKPLRSGREPRRDAVFRPVRKILCLFQLRFRRVFSNGGRSPNALRSGHPLGSPSLNENKRRVNKIIKISYFINGLHGFVAQCADSDRSTLLSPRPVGSSSCRCHEI